MECVDIATKYLHPAFAVTLLLSLFSLWRMKANTIDTFEEKFRTYPLWRQLLGDFVLPKSLLTQAGKKWHYLGIIFGVGLMFVLISYIYFGNQEWVCKWGPENSPTDIIKNVFRDS